MEDSLFKKTFIACLALPMQEPFKIEVRINFDEFLIASNFSQGDFRNFILKKPWKKFLKNLVQMFLICLIIVMVFVT